ncbi:MAG: hypothetical protein QOJ03_1293, partial [Frankiaceae bacterium]|nr:hypothetical protein [Frankiaceae bacterium]
QPDVSAEKHCLTGISVVLSNMNGTADTTFNVTAPDGSSESVPVRAGQQVKRSFKVKEDHTAIVTVTAPGLAKKTVKYAKDCATVLGVKHVKHPRTVVVQGEKETLPFTGFDARRFLMEAAALMFLGAMMCGVAGSRRRAAVSRR